MPQRYLPALLIAAALCAISPHSWGQQPGTPAPVPAPPPSAAPAPPPPGSPATQPPPATYPPPPGYPPQPGQPAPYGYGYPPPPGYSAYPAPPQQPQYQLAGPEFLPYEDGQEVPPGYVLQKRTKRGLIIAGSLMVGIPYLLGVSFSGDLDDENAWLLVPSIGPWLTLAGKDFSCSDDFDCADDRAVRTLLIMDGITQGVGTFLLIYGLASHSQRLVRQDLYKGFVVTPTFSARGAGLLATSEF